MKTASTYLTQNKFYNYTQNTSFLSTFLSDPWPDALTLFPAELTQQTNSNGRSTSVVHIQ